MKYLALLPLALFAALGGFFLQGLFRDDPDTLRSALIGRETPDLTVSQLEGRDLLTPELLDDGEVKLVNFWASWCVPCRVEHPQIADLATRVPVYGINHRDQADAANRFLDDLGDPYAAIGADPGRTAIDWGVTGFPETFVVDGDGIIRLRFAGPITTSVVTDTILPAIEAARGE